MVKKTIPIKNISETNWNDSFYLCVADCTGHGVPGAFKSLLNISFLNEAINEKNITSPDEILNYVRDRLIEEISQEGHRDGMDGVLFRFEKNHVNNSSIKITYAGAYNSPLLIRNKNIIEFPTDKMPIGKGEKNMPFTLYNYEPQNDDGLYLYSDGFADQFGGPKGKKFKYKQLE